MDIQSQIASNRLQLADFFDGLDESQLGSGSLCDA
jgi:hypothetical protein